MSYRINLRRHDNITFSASRDDTLYRSSRHQITLLSRHFWSSSIFVIAVRSSVDIQASFQMLFAPPFICLWYGICFRSRFYNHVETIHGVNSCSSLHANIFRFACQFEVEFVHNHRLDIVKNCVAIRIAIDDNINQVTEIEFNSPKLQKLPAQRIDPQYISSFLHQKEGMHNQL